MTSAYVASADMNGDGHIDVNEIVTVMRNLGYPRTLEEAKKIAESVDADGNGMIEFDEFVGMIASRMLRTDGVAELHMAFSTLFDDDSGFVDVALLRKLFKTCGSYRLSDEEVDIVLELCDVNADGRIPYQQVRHRPCCRSSPNSLPLHPPSPVVAAGCQDLARCTDAVACAPSRAITAARSALLGSDAAGWRAGHSARRQSREPLLPRACAETCARAPECPATALAALIGRARRAVGKRARTDAVATAARRTSAGEQPPRTAASWIGAWIGAGAVAGGWRTARARAATGSKVRCLTGGRG